MNSRLAVDSNNQLGELREIPRQPKAVHVFATIISYVFHPIFIPVYITWFLIFVHPYLFAGFSERNKMVVLLQSFVMFSFFPLVSVLLLKALKFISSIHLTTQRDRIIPFVVCGIWYFWIWYVWRNLPDYPGEAVIFAKAVFIASSAGLMANIYMKVSMHAIAVGVMSTLFVVLALNQELNFGIYLSIAFLITGLVCTARFLISDHTQAEVYVGFFLGVLAMVVAYITG